MPMQHLSWCDLHQEKTYLNKSIYRWVGEIIITVHVIYEYEFKCQEHVRISSPCPDHSAQSDVSVRDVNSARTQPQLTLPISCCQTQKGKVDKQTIEYRVKNSK